MTIQTREQKLANLLEFTAGDKRYQFKDFYQSYQDFQNKLHKTPYIEIQSLQVALEDVRTQVVKLCHEIKKEENRAEFIKIIDCIQLVDLILEECDNKQSGIPKKENILRAYIDDQLNKLGMQEEDVRHYGPKFFNYLTTNIIQFTRMTPNEIISFKTTNVDNNIIRAQMLKAIEQGFVE